MQLQALLISIISEAFVIGILLYRSVKPFKKLFIAALVPTLLVHPFLWTLSSSIPYFFTYSTWVILLESIVVLVEALILSVLLQRKFRLCVALSLLATLYPARKAASIDPAEALRYE